MLDEVDINAMDYPALSALKDRIEEKVREMREVGVCASMWELRWCPFAGFEPATFAF
jgi:hypothetical protein